MVDPGCQRDAKPPPAPSLPKGGEHAARGGVLHGVIKARPPSPNPALERGIRLLIEFESDGRPQQTRGPRGAKGRRKKTRKRGNCRGNKATMLFRISTLIQKWSKNKANLFSET